PITTVTRALHDALPIYREDPALDVQLVPVSIFVGRSPDKASGWFSVLFSENWAIVGRFRRLLAILLNGRDTLVQFAAPVSIRDLLAEDLPPERSVRKLSRVLRTHFKRLPRRRAPPATCPPRPCPPNPACPTPRACCAPPSPACARR